MSISELISVLILGVLGPFLCYLIVYGSTSIIKLIILICKQRRFHKRMEKAKSQMNEDDFDDIEVEVYTSEDIQQKVKENESI